MAKLSKESLEWPAFYLSCKLENGDQSEQDKKCPVCQYEKECFEYLSPLAEYLKKSGLCNE